MKNSILEKNHDKCTSCGICEGVCPKEAIKLYLNDEGFYQPKVDKKNVLVVEYVSKHVSSFKK